MFGLGVLITAILTTLTPFAADTSVWLLVALRELEGLSEVCKLYNHYTVIKVSLHKAQVNINLHSTTITTASLTGLWV